MPKARLTTIVAIGALPIVGVMWLFLYDEHRCSASDYPKLRAQMPSAMVADMPVTIPTNAKHVRLMAWGVRERFPAPDAKMELRYFVAPAEASQIDSAAKARDAALKSSTNFEWQNLVNGLHTADDGDPNTPLPPGFSSYLLSNPDGQNITGVTVNLGTGEVIHWFFEF